MSNFFEVTVAIKTESDKGKIKNVREVYLVDAMTLTEAEARVIKDFVKSGFSQDYNVVSAKESKIVNVIYAEEPKSDKKLVNPSHKHRSDDGNDLDEQ